LGKNGVLGSNSAFLQLLFRSWLMVRQLVSSTAQEELGKEIPSPLSPFLFVIVMKAFSRMVKASIDHSLFSGIFVGTRGREQVHISHLLFADDTLVFCGASRDQVQAIGNLLTCFELVSGLKVNLAKFILVPVGEVSNIGELAEVLGCEALYLLLTWVYL
jgi:hypothetical protein